MLQPILDAGAKIPGNPGRERGTQIAANHIAAQREGKSCLFQPPGSQVLPEFEALRRVGQLAFMDDEAELGVTRLDRGTDPVEGHYHGLEFGLIELEGEICSGAEARHRDATAPQGIPGITRRGSERNQPRSVSVAHRGAARQQPIALGEIGVGVDRNRGNLELTAQRALIERFDVGELVQVAELPGIELALGERIKHERVVGIGTVADTYGLSHGLNGKR